MDDGSQSSAERIEWKAMATKHYLLNNAHRRRIWLTTTPGKGLSFVIIVIFFRITCFIVILSHTASLF